MRIGEVAAAIHVEVPGVRDVVHEHFVGTVNDFVDFGFFVGGPCPVGCADLFVFSGLGDLGPNADFRHQAVQIDPFHNDADRADERAGIGDDFIGPDRGVVAPAGQQPPGIDDDGFFAFEPLEGVGDFERRRDGTAGGVDHEQYSFDAVVFPGFVEGFDRCGRIEDRPDEFDGLQIVGFEVLFLRGVEQDDQQQQKEQGFEVVLNVVHRRGDG